MATDVLPVVKIDDGRGGFYLINESDFDPKKHKKHGEKPARKPRAKKAAE
jgi:hypothetical protein